MTNREFCKDRLLDIALGGQGIGVDKKTLEPQGCRDLLCENCIGYHRNCTEVIKEWADAEHIEPCPFEKDELVEVSHDEKNWYLGYFSHIGEGYYFACFTGHTDSVGAIGWKYCQKYGTLGGLVKGEKEQKMKPRKKLGFLHRGEEFILDNVRYKALSADGNGYALCRNIESGKNKKICLDCEVEVKEQK